jgi:hypothetical protein
MAIDQEHILQTAYKSLAADATHHTKGPGEGRMLRRRCRFWVTLRSFAVVALTVGTLAEHESRLSADERSNRVARAKNLLSQGSRYTRGCSGFVAEVLLTPWADANALLGQSPEAVGRNNNYHNLRPGDVVGWPAPQGHGHVAVYIGEANMKFIDVPGPNQKPRAVRNGYGPQSVFKSRRF